MAPWAPLGKWLIGLGGLLILAGLVLFLGLKIPFLGRLPGDIYIKREHLTFYFPIVTCLVVSVILSLLLWFFSRRG
ncbi:MAG: DUF2905 domain-containing protein [Elusimicrobia bacterium]|nr:DUF2905 domain-containing protein [Elusimicrobiota bacterium]